MPLSQVTFLVDTGPIVSLLNRRDRHHRWAPEEFDKRDQPVRTCGAVLTEAYFLISKEHGAVENLHELVEGGAIRVSFSYADHVERIHILMRTYHNVPRSFADACLVCMSEIHRESTVFTIDSDLLIYCRRGDETIDVLMP